MSAVAPHSPVHGRVDPDGRLVEADGPLARLHARAGGTPGGPLVIPQLVALVRLVQRLGILVSRGVYAADGDRDLDLWIRAAPQDGGVALAIVRWTEQPARSHAASQAPERERDHLRSLAEWSWATDPHLRLLSLHAGSGSGPPDAAGQPLTRFFTLEPAPSGLLPIIEALAERAPFEDQRALYEGDARRPVRLAGAPIRAADGAFAGFSGTVTFLDPHAPVVQAPVAVDAFGERLGTALRGPIDRIITQAEAIRQQADGPLRQDYLAYASDIASAGRHLLGLIGDLVDLQAIERADFRARNEAIDLADVARRAAGLLNVRAANRDVRIDAPALDVALPARGEFGRALQIMVNLVGNAVRYSPPGSSVRISGDREGGQVRIVVTDEGKGIAPEDQQRVFEKFERVDPTEPGGTGLGLYIARRLARAMGGDILLESAAGQGARFMLVLPAGG
jgi:signal transduction histidine kinase